MSLLVLSKQEILFKMLISSLLLKKLQFDRVYAAVFTGNILGFLSGISSSWSSPTIPKLIRSGTEDYPFDRPVTDDELSWISCLLNFGAIFGSVIVGVMAEKLGRKVTIICIAIPFVVGYTMLAMAKHVYTYMAARILLGLPVGGTCMILPTYIGEISHDYNRGLLIASNKSFMLFGMLFSYSVGPFIDIALFNFFIMLIPVFFIPFFYLVAPESPYYLVSVNKITEALDALKQLRQDADLDSSIKELNDIQHNVQSHQSSLRNCFNSVAATRALFIVATLLSLQQFSGINQIIQRSQRIFEIAETRTPPVICPIIIGGVQFVICNITPLLSDKVGRRLLLFISSTGAALTLAVLGLYFYLKDRNVNMEKVYWLPLVCMVLYIAIYNCGLNAVPWTVMGELFPMDAKSTGSSICTAIYFFIGFLITLNFTPVRNSIGMGSSFWIFSGFCIIINIYVYFFLIETKGKSLEEIQVILRSRHKI